jgi:mRNA interferase RelE/StbE
MASYRIDVSATAERQIRKLPRAEQVRVLRAIVALSTEPRPPGCRKLSAHDDVFRIRVARRGVLSVQFVHAEPLPDDDDPVRPPGA